MTCLFSGVGLGEGVLSSRGNSFRGIGGLRKDGVSRLSSAFVLKAGAAGRGRTVFGVV